MARSDWIGLSASVGVHGALLLLFALLAMGRPETPVPGALQLEVGTFAEGRPLQQATPPDDAPASSASESPAPAETQSPPAEEEAPEPASEPTTPVELPEQEAPAGDDPPPEQPPTEEKPAPETSSDTDTVNEATPSEEQTTSDASSDTSSEEGAETGQATGAASGEEGTEDDAEKASPFDIEGLDRTRLHGGLPQYTEKVNATIKVEITVGPQGRVVGQRILQKANPSLEQSVLETLRRWRFNRLPADAPQKNQTGVVTFRFRLE